MTNKTKNNRNSTLALVLGVSSAVFGIATVLCLWFQFIYEIPFEIISLLIVLPMSILSLVLGDKKTSRVVSYGRALASIISGCIGLFASVLIAITLLDHLGWI